MTKATRAKPTSRAKSSEAMAPLDSNGRQELKARASREPQGGAGKAPETRPCGRRENRVRAPEVAA